MYKFDKILVALDNSQMDEQLIESARFISDLSESGEVHFVNIVKDFDTPAALLDQLPNIITEALKDRKQEIMARVQKVFDTEDPTVHVHVIKGLVLRGILNYSNENDIDLIIVGRKRDKKAGGILNTRLARRASCSLMIMPEDAPLRVKNILVPLDFSEYSNLAMELALRIAKKKDAKVIAQNVYQIPVGYHYSGKTKAEFAQIMEQHAARSFEMLTKTMDLKGINLEKLYTQSADEHLMEDVYKTALKTNADSIIVGVKGRTATTALFIGSKAEKLIKMDEKIPLVVVRPKGRNAGIIEYLQEL